MLEEYKYHKASLLELSTPLLDQIKNQPFLSLTLAMPDYKDIDFINLNDISNAPPTMPKAEYHLKIVEAVLKQNNAKDGYYISYRTVVQSGEFAGQSFYSMWSLKEKVAFRMKRDFEAMGYQPPNGKPHLADLIGFEGIASVKDEPAKDGFPAKNAVDRWLGPLK